MRHVSLLIAAVLGLLLAAAGCTPSAAPPTGGAPGAGQPSKVDVTKPIIIGAAISQTGKYERTGLYMFRGYQLAVNMINERGGIQGRPLQLKVYDDGSEPATAVKLYQKLLTQDKVDLLLGPYSSAVTNAVVPIFEQAETPVVTVLGSDPGIWEGKNLRWTVQLINSSKVYLLGSLELAAKQGAKTVALVYENTAFPIAMAEGIREKAKELGLKIVLDEAYPSGIKDYAPLASKAKTSGAEVFMGGGYFPDSVALTKATAAVDYKPMLQSWAVGPAGKDYADAVGDLATCVIGNSSWLPQLKTKGFISDNPTFLERYQALWHENPEYHAPAGFGGVELLAQALDATLKDTGKVDKAAIQKYMFSTETDTIFGHYKVVPSGPNAGLQVGLIPFQVQWQKNTSGNLTLEAVYPEAFATAKPCFRK